MEKQRWEESDGKAEVGRVREEKRREETRRDEKRKEEERDEKRREEERRSEKRKRRERVRRKSQKKEDAGAQKGRKVSISCVFLAVVARSTFPRFVAPEGRKEGGCGAIWPDEVRATISLEGLHFGASNLQVC